MFAVACLLLEMLGKLQVLARWAVSEHTVAPISHYKNQNNVANWMKAPRMSVCYSKKSCSSFPLFF